MNKAKAQGQFIVERLQLGALTREDIALRALLGDEESYYLYQRFDPLKQCASPLRLGARPLSKPAAQLSKSPEL